MWHFRCLSETGGEIQKKNELVFTKGQWVSLRLYLNDWCPCLESCGSSVKNGFSSWKGNVTLRSDRRGFMGDKSEQSQHGAVDSKCLLCSVRRHCIPIEHGNHFFLMDPYCFYMCLPMGTQSQALSKGWPKLTDPISGSLKSLRLVVLGPLRWMKKSWYILAPEMSGNHSLFLLWAYDVPFSSTCDMLSRL